MTYRLAEAILTPGATVTGRCLALVDIVNFAEQATNTRWTVTFQGHIFPIMYRSTYSPIFTDIKLAFLIVELTLTATVSGRTDASEGRIAAITGIVLVLTNSGIETRIISRLLRCLTEIDAILAIFPRETWHAYALEISGLVQAFQGS